MERRADLKLVVAQIQATIAAFARHVEDRLTDRLTMWFSPGRCNGSGPWRTPLRVAFRYAIRMSALVGRSQLCSRASTFNPTVFCLNWGSAISRLLITGIQTCAMACHVVFTMSPPPIGHGFPGCPIPVNPIVKRGSPMARLPIGGCRY
ncbi:hypothetical protein PhaeoP23_02350 [Phaeobacter piscinae]|uniref:Transposase n=1 Tax=Phaeobacter piscinae TaxID=1580596 RepID=A0ABM6PFN2_9RHOB|nr:hypothetical protein PhaeoP36_02350 [Phaeobacter piscinae]AUQ86990.1 hypothetical protein PhaeoP42_02351 [Phaeobacter piscinae]AUR24873.1 hypothetical protein PhaeoP23_02350 [Phaeobacter piscinae]